jgi:hypothetical protein
MRQPSLRAPLGLLAAGLLFGIFLLTRPTSTPATRAQGYTTSPTATTAPTNTTQPAATAVRTTIPNATSAPAPTAAVPQPPTSAPIVAPTVTPRPPASQPTAAPTATVVVEVASGERAITCPAGEIVEIKGSGPPRAPVLIYFNERAIGGGSVRPDGTFIFPLKVGDERPGSYPVVVRTRGAWEVLVEVECVVPYLSPTPRVAR